MVKFRRSKSSVSDIKTGSGTTKTSQSKLGSKWLALAFVIVFGGLGSYLLFFSHADNTQVPCAYVGSGHHSCNFYKLPTPVVNPSGTQVGTFKYAKNWVICQTAGAEVHNGAYFNKWWGWTLSDQNTWGWVNAVYGSGGANDGSFAGVPACTSAHTSSKPPQPAAAAPAPRPAPAPAPAPAANTVVAYSGNNDGCGGNATHYNGSTHVAQTHYGSGSVCKCNNGKVVAYGSAIPDSQNNPGCTSTASSTPAPAPKPATAPATTPASGSVVAYSGNNDGCGDNATHYSADGKTKVGQSNYGTGSYCKCDNGTRVNYGTVIYLHGANNPSCITTSQSKSCTPGTTGCSNIPIPTSSPAASTVGGQGVSGTTAQNNCGYSGNCSVSKAPVPIVSPGRATSNRITECDRNGGTWKNGQCVYPAPSKPSNSGTTQASSNANRSINLLKSECDRNGGTWKGNKCVYPTSNTRNTHVCSYYGGTASRAHTIDRNGKLVYTNRCFYELDFGPDQGTQTMSGPCLGPIVRGDCKV